jgi:Formin Homology 2 Domain
LDATSLKALKEMLATPDEKAGLLSYMSRCGNTDESKEKAYAELSECEKYMYTMLKVDDAPAKFDCMQFRSQFKVRYDELMESIGIIEKACDEVRTSEKLQTIMAMILTLVNEINTGGDGNEAAGFTLDALLKLNEVSAVGFAPFGNAVLTHLTAIFLFRQRLLTRKLVFYTIL